MSSRGAPVDGLKDRYVQHEDSKDSKGTKNDGKQGEGTTSGSSAIIAANPFAVVSPSSVSFVALCVLCVFVLNIPSLAVARNGGHP